MFREKFKRLAIRSSKFKFKLQQSLMVSRKTFQAFHKLKLNPKKDFPDLSPNEDAELVEPYIERLDTLIFTRGNTIKEIAVTSPYSGGKSSFLRTYMKRRPSLLIEVISLVAVKSLEEKSEQKEGNLGASTVIQSRDNESQTEEKENKIEKSILQQLLYRTSSNKANYSRFRRIFPHPLGSVTGILMSVWLIFTGFVYYTLYTRTIEIGQVINTLLEYDAYSLQRYTSFEFACIVFLTALPVLLVKDSIQFFRSYSITKLNPLKGEFAFSEKSNDSIFNKYLEEIIYYFAEQKTDVVIFEDLDRFETPEIFVNLKELNKLLNDSADVKQPVRFIYALKDDVFKGKTRTKFFDSIIPIIPYASTSNSYPELCKLIERYHFNKELDDEFIRDISVFLDDMRMINNIVAEYAIYKDVLMESSKSRDFKKLFAFIIYKNNYSDDFALLNQNLGKLSECFKGILEVKNGIKKQISEDIAKFEERIKTIENEQLETEEELISLFFRKLFNAHYIKQNRQLPTLLNIDLASLCEYSKFMELYDSPNQHSFPAHDNYNRNQSKTFKAYVELLSDNILDHLASINLTGRSVKVRH